MKINKKLLPLKIHFFLFMGGVGAVGPYLVVFGKQMGISSVLMGTINGIQPLFYILIKPLAGILMDYFHKRRSLIFSLSILLMATFYALTYVALPSSEDESDITKIAYPNSTNFNNNNNSSFQNQMVGTIGGYGDGHNNNKSSSDMHSSAEQFSNDYPIHQQPSDTTVWTFLLFMVLGLIMFNICNSYSDTVCFDILGDGKDKEYGKQRVWGGIGYGICAGLSGLLIDVFSGDSGYKNNTPAFVILLLFAIFDVLVSLNLKPSKRSPSPSMFKDVLKILKNLEVAWFLLITLVLGMCDSFLLYFVLWHLEDISIATGTFGNIRTIEGILLLGETFLGETIFFHYSGYIIDKIGYNASFVLCLLCYAVRFGILSIIPGVWWALPSECIFQASFALGYTLVVSYTNHISTDGIQATMQSVSMTVFNGLAYSLGSFSGGLSFKYVGGRGTFALMSLLCLITATLSIIVFITLNWRAKCNHKGAVQKSNNVPEENDSSDVNKPLTLDAL